LLAHFNKISDSFARSSCSPKHYNMKKLFFFITSFLFSYQFSNAQTEKGTQNLGLDLGYSYNGSTGTNINPNGNLATTLNVETTSFNIGPTYSYFIANNISIGGSLYWSGSNTTDNTGDIATTNDAYPTTAKVTNYNAQLFADKYFMHKNKIGFRVEAYMGYGVEKQVNTYSTSYVNYDFNGTDNYYFGGIYLDLVYYPTKKLGLSAKLASLAYEHYSNNNTSQGHNIGDTLNFSSISDGLSLSVFYVFGRK